MVFVYLFVWGGCLFVCFPFLSGQMNWKVWQETKGKNQTAMLFFFQKE